jgi:bile acid-coenzyme A ligase
MISFGARLTALAAIRGDRPAITLVTADGTEQTLSWRELDRRSNRAARLLASRGAIPGRFVVVLLPTSLEHYIATYGAWKTGAGVLPLNPAMPPRELDALLSLANPSVVVRSDRAGGPTPIVTSAELDDRSNYSDDALPDRIPEPGKAIASGGSTGRPKLIVDPARYARVPGSFVETIGRHVGLAADQVQLVAGPLYHNLGFNWGTLGLFEGHRLVVLQRFDPNRLLDAVERHRVQFMIIVPTMMARVAALPRARTANWSTIEGIAHTAAPCPPFVKRAWLDFVGPTRLFEAFGATEGVGLTVIRGDEWLERPGSVGRPLHSKVVILDEAGRPVPPGQVGEIFMRSEFAAGKPYEYLGAGLTKRAHDGLESVGDLGYVDEAGYLFPADRRMDLIITGGANVYPAEVEAALAEHPQIRDVAVIGLPDPDWGKRVHAIIELEPGAEPPDVEALKAHCRDRLAGYKSPKSFEFVDRLPRDDAGKLRRRALVDQRS